MQPANRTQSGVIVRVIDLLGYGFIRRDRLGSDVFLHIHALAKDGGLEWGPALVDCRVTFEEIYTERGPRAVNVRSANSKDTK